jgi:hypothetical protein
MKLIENWQSMVARARARRIPVGVGYDATKDYVLGAALALECQVCHQPMLIETPIYLVHQTCAYGCGSWVWHHGGIWEWSYDGESSVHGLAECCVRQSVQVMRARRAFIAELRQEGNIPFDRC